MIKIISGAQTGADRAAIDFAIYNGLDYGGWVPKGRKAEDGPISPGYAKLQEHTSPQYPPRTAANVKDSDITLIFTMGPMANESGCALTLRLCDKMKKPNMFCDLSQVSDEDAAFFIRPVLKDTVYKVINVAGSRESKAKGIYDRVYKVLTLAWKG